MIRNSLTKVVAVSGSLRFPSYTSDLLQIAVTELVRCGADVQVLDLRALSLPFCTGVASYPGYPGVHVWQAAMKQAKALLFVTPEYHGSMSGVLKNALDLLDEETLAGKVVALAAVLGGHHSTGALHTLRQVLRQMNAWVVPRQLIVAHADTAFDEQRQLRDPLLSERLHTLVTELLRTAEKL